MENANIARDTQKKSATPQTMQDETPTVTENVWNDFLISKCQQVKGPMSCLRLCVLLTHFELSAL